VTQPVKHVVARAGQAAQPATQTVAAAPVVARAAQPAQDAVGSLLGRP
jgi:hypothetical protein